MKRLLAFSFVAALNLTACGQIGLGARAIPNDPAPVGTIVAHGVFSGLNGHSMTGAASIYRQTSSGAYWVRLEGIVAPDEAGLQLVARADGAIVFQAALVALQGTQNYVTNVTGTPTWNSVTIKSTSNPLTPEYATALLQQP